MNKVLLTDCDDVLLHFAGHFEEWVKNEKNYQPIQRLIDVFHIPEWLGVAQEQADFLLHEFISSPQRYRNIPAYEDALEIVPQLRKDGWDINVITAVPDRKWMRRLRRQNIEEHFGRIFNQLHLTGFGHHTKKDVLSSYAPTYYVEDLGHHAEAGLDAGHTVFLMDRKYNRHVEPHERLIRVNSWHEVADYIDQAH